MEGRNEFAGPVFVAVNKVFLHPDPIPPQDTEREPHRSEQTPERKMERDKEEKQKTPPRQPDKYAISNSPAPAPAPDPLPPKPARYIPKPEIKQSSNKSEEAKSQERQRVQKVQEARQKKPAQTRREPVQVQLGCYAHRTKTQTQFTRSKPKKSMYRGAQKTHKTSPVLHPDTKWTSPFFSHNAAGGTS